MMAYIQKKYTANPQKRKVFGRIAAQKNGVRGSDTETGFCGQFFVDGSFFINGTRAMQTTTARIVFGSMYVPLYRSE